MNRELIDYVWSFYGPGNLKSYFFKDKLLIQEVEVATGLVEIYFKLNNEYFEVGSFEREITRDLMLKMFNYEYDYLEYKDIVCNIEKLFL